MFDVRLLAILYLCSSVIFADDTPHRRFEYKYSFKGPYLAQKNNEVPFWTYSGNAIASAESLRITPSLRSQKGQAWAKRATEFDWWEVELVFRITGRGRVGADGLALWYTATPGVEGPVFGSSDKWNGLGLFFDSFDNDNKRNNPYISLMVNDGTKPFDHENDGISQAVGGCLRDYRNKPHPVRAKIEYYRNTLTLLIHNGLTNNAKDYEICARVEGIQLPARGFFGLSAATGGLADDHDVHKFLVTSLHDKKDFRPAVDLDIDAKFKKEFEEYSEKTKKAREEYLQQNPDAKPSHAEDDEDEFDAMETRELRQIFQGQSQMYEVLKKLNDKMDDIVGRQERTLSLMGSVHSSVSGGAVPSGAALPAPGAGGMQRHEVDQLINTQRDIVNAARDVKNVVNDINQKSAQLLASAGRGAGTATPVGTDAVLRELQDGLRAVRAVLSGDGRTACPASVAPWLFLGVAVVQVLAILGYMLYRDGKEAQAKKFY